MYLGIDCGSVSMKAVVINNNNEIIDSVYKKNIGLVETIKAILSELNKEKIKEIKGSGVTGSGKEFIGKLIGSDILESEIFAHFIATITLYPSVKTIFDIGGEDCKLMIVKNGIVYPFAMNKECGGGTGEMIESIARRMGIKLENIGSTAMKSKIEVSIPSKCGIFAQSAVVSKLNKGVNKEDILMGVCRGLVGNYFAMLAGGKNLKPDFVFQGATAKNKALVYCFEQELGEKIIVPERPELMGALGMALLVKEKNIKNTAFKGFGISKIDYETKTYYGKGCSNNCEITEIFEDNRIVAVIGNRCDKCLRGL